MAMITTMTGCSVMSVSSLATITIKYCPNNKCIFNLIYLIHINIKFNIYSTYIYDVIYICFLARHIFNIQYINIILSNIIHSIHHCSTSVLRKRKQNTLVLNQSIPLYRRRSIGNITCWRVHSNIHPRLAPRTAVPNTRPTVHCILCWLIKDGPSCNVRFTWNGSHPTNLAGWKEGRKP